MPHAMTSSSGNKSNDSTFWHGDDSMIRSCKQHAASDTMLDSVRKDECGEASDPKEAIKMEATLLPTQTAKQADIYEDTFNRQKAYFASNITRSYEWRVDQLDRLAKMLSEHTSEFYDALSRDFKT